ncbi:efflux RND transporter periplasmic adaptor subunit [Microbulbifer salipaludis]|uniref:Efflux RND transporter periplasmic adaptor subunit n=1 Tax=Microbulbifer salipaludis TaxID=187980 RepID=A0ABS3EAB8_9GAMM|nr:efflux RND transporter periplasmic adaptor subunit [Microbulbifer salipaludis]MBN8432133.1 efflux RND transporter periplasmic adaptor subunit [Microbulbifer salipaludis]
MARFLVFVFLLSGLLGVLGLQGCAEEEAPEAPKPPPVEVLTARAHQVVPRYEYVGRVEATDEYKVRPRVEGYIESRNFVEGQMIREGELLYVIDPRPFVAALENQRANLSQARSALAIAERNYRRGEELVRTGAISKVQMDELTGNYESAQSQMEAIQADVETAELNLSFTEIRAPLTGIIGRSQFTDGSLVGPMSEPLTTIVRMDPILVNFEVPEHRLFVVQEEAARRRQQGIAQERRDVRIKQPNGEMYPYPGLLVFVDNQIDPNTGSALVRARFPNPEQLLIQGQFVRVEISVFSGSEGIKPLVPQAAVQEDMQGRFVYVVDDQDIAHKRYLELGQREGELWAVTDGIKAGERLIVNGLQRVNAGQPVTPQNTQLDPYKGLQTVQPPDTASPVMPLREGEVTEQERRESGATDPQIQREQDDATQGKEPDAYFDGK